MNMLKIMEWVIGIALIGSAIACINTEKVLSAVIRLSLLSMLAVLAFALLRAPDVAVTEAVIGSGLTTFVFIMVIKDTLKKEGQNEESH